MGAAEVDPEFCLSKIFQPSIVRKHRVKMQGLASSLNPSFASPSSSEKAVSFGVPI